MTDALKAARKKAKASHTREVNKMRRLVAEDDVTGVNIALDRVRDSFRTFEQTHLAFHEVLEEDAAIDESDTYFLEVQEAYIVTVKSTKAWIKSVADKTDSSGATKGYVSLMNLPRVELEPFNGDPLRYHNFVAVFDEAVDKVLEDDAAKLTRLLQYTTGRAKDAIRSCILSGDEGYTLARTILEKRFGNDHLITEHIVANLRHGKPIKSPEELQHLADEMTSSVATLSRMKALGEIDTQACIVEVVERLQPYLRTRWKRQAMEVKRDTGSYPPIRTFAEFIAMEADEAMDPVYGRLNNKPSKPVSTSASYSSTVYKPQYQNSTPCVICKENHRLWNCEDFRKMKPADRLDLVKRKHLCENCLLSNHTAQNCRKPSVCAVPGCGLKHTKFIHVNQNQPHAGMSSVCKDDKRVVSNASASSGNGVYMPVVKAKVNNSDVNVLLDTASSNSFCTRSLVRILGLEGKPVSYQLSTLSQPEECRTADCVDLQLSSSDGVESLYLHNVYVVDKIPVYIPPLAIRNYAHLNDLTLASDVQDVQILLGQDNAEALIPLDVRRGFRGEPYAVRTLFGWALNGPATVSNCTNARIISNFISTTVLEEKVEKLWSIENEGLANDKLEWSTEDRGVVELWDREVRLVDKHYELPIPWKPDVNVPDNFTVAQSRLRSLRTSLMKRALVDRYDSEITKLVESGYAEKVDVSDLDVNHKVWYLPHHAVITEKKPGKVRIVFDCASKYKGESLNDKCFQGPDLNNRLLHVLLRFRQYEYAVMADIEAMYYQVRIPIEQRDVLRFLWLDSDGEIVVYRMTCHVFGGIWCSSSSTYALRRTIVDNENVDLIVADTVRNSFYVDDCLRSVASKDEALAVISGTKQVLSEGGFKLTKFVVNSEDLLLAIPEEDRAKEVKGFGPECSSKALGMRWDVASDVFCTEVGVEPAQAVTRRGMLSIIASAFDPLGIVGPVLIQGRILFQDATRLGLSWDDNVSGELEHRWKTWVSSLRDLSAVKLTRGVIPAEHRDSYFELHHFSDASERAYGCCSFLRAVNMHGEIHVSFLMSKAKVAPIKTVSIPRLELQAAVIASQVDSMLRQELTIGLSRSYFWTDSELVLRYVKNDRLRLHVYVANRVAAIRSVSQPSQWFHVPGMDNPADAISRGQSPYQLVSSAWFKGPDFLCTYKSQWNVQSSLVDLSESDPEVKKTVSCMATLARDPVADLLSHYSDYFRLKRAVAWLLRFKFKLKNGTCSGGSLSVSELREAEIAIVRYVQSQVYGKEMVQLSKGRYVNKSSCLASLSPFLDEYGILRVGGRIVRSSQARNVRQPYVVPHSHHVARLIAKEYHSIAHLGTEWVVSLIRRKFWITKIRKVVKGVSRNCITCMKLFSSPCTQKMSDLPVERLEANKPVFWYTGLDCFGPFLVKRGRSEVKRYGCVYTCLTTRAIHIEKLDSLETDSFLNGFRRFISRRSCPDTVFSDNGTNFVGGRVELERVRKMYNQKDLERFGLEKGISWIFTPPGASHMGGIYERMIRTIRKVLLGMFSSHTSLTDEILSTLFCEVENIVNSRPITKVSDDVMDPNPLTPNHLLLLKDSTCVAPGVFHETDVYRKRWRYVQSLANQFWRRWLREYIPELQRRAKWTKEQRNLRKGDLVLICNENTPRGLWPIGIVDDVNIGRDSLVRSVKVRTKSTTLLRPVTKVVLLEGSSVSDEIDD